MIYVIAAAGLVALCVGFALGDPVVIVLSAVTAGTGFHLIARRHRGR